MRHSLICAAALAVALTGCGQGGSGRTPAKAASDTQPPRPAPTACADKVPAKKLPGGFPKAFRLPPGTVVTGSEMRSGDLMIVTATSPQEFRTVLSYFNSELPKAGFKPSGGEVEDNDAESNFTGASYRGRWTLRALLACDGDTLITVLLTPR
ncbi:MAG: hypothetical protein WCB04_14840 [Mycobacteriales bacterium]